MVQGCSPHVRPMGHAQELDTVQRQRGAHHPPVLHVYGGVGSGEGGGGGGGGGGERGGRGGGGWGGGGDFCTPSNWGTVSPSSSLSLGNVG